MVSPQLLQNVQPLQAFQALQALRGAHRVIRFVLVWFVLSLGVTIASPLVNPQAIELICTGTGVMKVLVKNADGTIDDGGIKVASRMLDCPLCASVSAPPSAAQAAAEPAQPLGYVLQTIPAAHIAARTAAPPPGRGPPAFS
jgi:hypothetical protein